MITKISTEIFVRNLESQYTAMNLASKHIAAVPKIAIFWIDDLGGEKFKLYYNDTLSPREAEFMDGVKVHPSNHFVEWPQVQKKNPAWIGKNYMAVPRGRISLVPDPDNPHFLIYMPPQYQGNEILESQICNEFDIPRSAAKFEYNDVHYKTR